MKTCPNCGMELTDEMINVNMCWECGYILDASKTDDAYDVAVSQRNELKKRNYARSIGKRVEYGVDTYITDADGYTDAEELESLLNDRAENGWHLKNVYSNTLGVNAIRVLGVGTNSAVSQAVMIFERELE